MENFSKDIVDILQYLLPGFLAAWVFYSFTSFSKPSQFERVIQALIFTLIVQFFVFVEKNIALRLGLIPLLGDWARRSDILCSTLNAIFLGATVAYFANNDKFHKMARKIGITKETSYPSEWFGVFMQEKNITYVVLHLKDERRLYGWPIEWPSEPNRGHFELVEASWLVGNDNNDQDIDLNTVSSILIDVKDVKWVEFMKKIVEGKNG